MMFTEKRLGKITDELKVLSRKKVDCSMVILAHQGKTHWSFLEKSTEKDWQKFEKYDTWGEGDGHCWFKVEVHIPETIDGMGAVLVLSTGHEGEWDDKRSQFLAFIENKPVEAMDINHREYKLNDCVKVNEVYKVDLEGFFESEESERIPFKCVLAGVDKTAEKLYYHMDVLLKCAILLNENDSNRINIINHLVKAVAILDLRYPYSSDYYETIETAIQYLETNVYGTGNTDVSVTAIGHTHIDVAWLWDLQQTREKVIRSFSSMLKLIERYPEFSFMSSQPQLYQFLKEDYPEVYEVVKKRISEGRWEAEGAMWLEADCNIPSGESLVRQIIHGKNFFKNEFGIDSKILWLPDVFGYSAALPQIMKKTGVEYFMTTKISWNEYNKMPYDTFYWEGIDGSRILTHFITTTSDYDLNPNITSYTGMLNPKHVKGTWDRYQQKELCKNVLIAYGYGDGGGGTTPEMIENAIRLSKGVPGMPKVKFGTATEYFDSLKESVEHNDKTPSWVGELYLEFHRGTYTSMARNKKYNRKSENIYLDAELFSILNQQLNGKRYPSEQLHEGWETILLNQFHDIIPGSSIKRVYDQSKEQYENIIKTGKSIIDNCLLDIAQKVKGEKQVVVFNDLSFKRDGIIELPDDFEDITALGDGKTEYAVQKLKDGRRIAWVGGIPSKGYKSFSSIKQPYISEIESSLNVTEKGMSNNFFEIKFDDSYNIDSIIDKRFDRQVLKRGNKGNRLIAYEDKPYDYDAWDINIYYREKHWDVDNVTGVTVLENGPARGCLQVTKRFMESQLVQRIYIYADNPVIDFETEVDWKQEHILLKAEFPVDVHTDKATYEIQYGNVQRPTHWNTSWDMAKFEVCGHKWCDLSEEGYGVSILNDCKYGYDIKDGVMRLTLLKSATWPNPEADKEHHVFTYSLYPHAGDFRKGETVNKAYALNNPLVAVSGGCEEGCLDNSYSFVNIDNNNVIIEVVKESQDSEGVVIRLYEFFNRRSKCNMTFAEEFKEACECNLLEEPVTQSLKCNSNSLLFEIMPYEIKTFKLKFK